MPGLVACLDMQVDEVVCLEGLKGGVRFSLVVRVV